MWDDDVADLAHDWASTCRGGHPNAPSESSGEANYITDPNHPDSAPFWKLGQNTAVGEFSFEMYAFTVTSAKYGVSHDTPKNID